jgi:hypothetical protein
VRPYPLLAERLTNRDVGHKAVMVSLPDDLGPNPRQAADALWRFNAPADLLVVQSAAKVRSDILGTLHDEREIRFPGAGERLTISVAVTCQKTPPAQVPTELRSVLKLQGCYRSRRVVVPESERTAWFTARLARCGFVVEEGSVQLSRLLYADLGRRGGAIPYVEAVCSGLVADAALFSNVVRKGLGQGRSFGLGLIDLG